ECSRQVALAEGQQTNPVIGKREAAGVSNLLGNPQSFFPKGLTLSERAQFGMTHGEPGTGVHGGKHKLTKAFTAPYLAEERYGLFIAVNRPTIVALGLVDTTEGPVPQRV